MNVPGVHAWYALFLCNPKCCRIRLDITCFRTRTPPIQSIVRPQADVSSNTHRMRPVGQTRKHVVRGSSVACRHYTVAIVMIQYKISFSLKSKDQSAQMRQLTAISDPERDGSLDPSARFAITRTRVQNSVAAGAWSKRSTLLPSVSFSRHKANAHNNTT